MPDHFRPLELLTLGVYLVALLGIGLRSARQVKTSIDYTLAGRNVSWVIVLATTAATMVGGAMSVGFVSRVYEVGIAAAVVTIGAYISLILTGLFIAPKLRGLDLITVGDYFDLKYGKLARMLAAVLTIVTMCVIVVAQMVAMGTVTNTVLGVDYRIALAVGAAVTIFYSTLGGLRAVIQTDVLQFVILVGGFGAAAAIFLGEHGGLQLLAERVGAAHFELTGTWSMTRVVTFLFAVFLGESLAAPFVVRCLISKDPQGAKWGVAGAGVLLLLFLPMVTLVLGTAALADPGVNKAVLEAGGNAQIAFPTLMRTSFHPIFAGVMIAAIIAAVMSSADSCISCLATAVMEDVYRELKPQATDRQLLRVAKWTTFFAGVGAATCAFFFRDIVDLIEFSYDFWGASMVVPFLVGTFFYRRQLIYATVAAMAVGLAASICWRFTFGMPWDISPALFGFTMGGVTVLITYPLTRNLPLGRLFTPR